MFGHVKTYSVKSFKKVLGLFEPLAQNGGAVALVTAPLAMDPEWSIILNSSNPISASVLESNFKIVMVQPQRVENQSAEALRNITKLVLKAI